MAVHKAIIKKEIIKMDLIIKALDTIKKELAENDVIRIAITNEKTVIQVNHSKFFGLCENFKVTFNDEESIHFCGEYDGIEIVTCILKTK